MRELGEQPDGAGGCGCVHRSTSLFVASSCQELAHIGVDPRTLGRECARKIVDDGVEALLARASLEDLDGDRVRLQHALGREQQPFVADIVMFEAHPARQARP